MNKNNAIRKIKRLKVNTSGLSGMVVKFINDGTIKKFI